jgi:hypothetical protein
VLSAVLLGSAIMLADSLQHVTQHINRQAVFWGSRWSPSPLPGGFGARNIRYCRR